MNKKEKKRFFLYLVTGSLLLFAGGFFLHLLELPGEMRFAAIVPDGTENALGAYNFYRYGKFEFALNHVWHPVRYPVFYQLLILLPGILLSGGELVWGVAGVWFCLFLAALFLLLLGKRCGNFMGGLIAAGALCCVGEVHFLANSAMTEIPYMGLLLAGAFLFLSFVRMTRETPGEKKLILFSLLCGSMFAVTGGIRPTALPMLLLFLPFLYFAKTSWKIKFFSAFVLFLPALLLVLAVAFYQYKVFGDPFRSGYHYWCPVPYDFPGLSFQLSYIPRSLERLFHSWNLGVFLLSPLLFILSRLIRRRTEKEKCFRKEEELFFLFAISQLLIILFLYLPYWGFVTRYCIGASTLLLLSGILSAGRLFRHFIPFFSFRKSRFYLLEGGIAFLLLGVGFFLVKEEKKIPVTYTEVEFLKFCDEKLPANAGLISTFNPALTEIYFVEKSPDRCQIPFTRNLEYTDKVIAPKSIRGAIPAPEKDDDHMRAFSAPGTLLPFPEVLAETLPSKWTGKEKVRFHSLPDPGKTPIYMTNLALYQIPRELQQGFFRRFHVVKLHTAGPMTIYRLQERK